MANGKRNAKDAGVQAQQEGGFGGRGLPAEWRGIVALGAVVVIVTFASFVPALFGEFLNWDDFANITENRAFRGLGLANLKWMFTTFRMGPYQPLSWVTLGIDYLVWGLDPFGYHLTNVVLHSVSAGLFYAVAAGLMSCGAGEGGRRKDAVFYGCAALAALFYAVHPLRVESVAWVTERRDVLNGCFVLLTVFLYVKACRKGIAAGGRRRLLTASVAAYGCSLLAKGMSMTLPAVLLVLDVYPLRRLSWKPGQKLNGRTKTVLIEKIPFFCLAALAAGVAMIGQRRIDALATFEAVGLMTRFAVIAYGVVFYVGKTLVPLDLSPMYDLDTGLNPFDIQYVASAVTAAGVTAVLLALRRRWPAALAAWLVYLIVLSPVSGISQAGPQIAADRYSYLPCMPFAVLAGGGLLAACRSRRGSGRAGVPAGVVLAAGAAVVVFLGVLTWRQCRVWRDSEALWSHAVAGNPNSVVARVNLGMEYRSRGDPDRAITEYEKALAVGTSVAKVHYNLGQAYEDKGDLGRAIAHYDKAIACYAKEVARGPRVAGAHKKMGLVYLRTGRMEEAVAALAQAISLGRSDVQVHAGLGGAYLILGKEATAVDHYKEVLRLDPGNCDAHYGLALAHHELGESAEARRHLERALELGFEVPPGGDAFIREVRGTGGED